MGMYARVVYVPQSINRLKQVLGPDGFLLQSLIGSEGISKQPTRVQTDWPQLMEVHPKCGHTAAPWLCHYRYACDPRAGLEKAGVTCQLPAVDRSSPSSQVNGRSKQPESKQNAQIMEAHSVRGQQKRKIPHKLTSSKTGSQDHVKTGDKAHQQRHGGVGRERSQWQAP